MDDNQRPPQGKPSFDTLEAEGAHVCPFLARRAPECREVFEAEYDRRERVRCHGQYTLCFFYHVHRNALRVRAAQEKHREAPILTMEDRRVELDVVTEAAQG